MERMQAGSWRSHWDHDRTLCPTLGLHVDHSFAVEGRVVAAEGPSLEEDSSLVEEPILEEARRLEVVSSIHRRR